MHNQSSVIHKISILLLAFNYFGNGAEKSELTYEKIKIDPVNLFKIRVQQNPDNGDRKSYKNAHPAMVLYIYKIDEKFKVLQVGFTPRGDIYELFWWRREKSGINDDELLDKNDKHLKFLDLTNLPNK